MDDDVPYFGAPPENDSAHTPVCQPARHVKRPAPRRGGGGVLKAILTSILVALLVFILLSPPVINIITGNFSPYGRVFPEEAEYTIERRIDIRSLGGDVSYTLDLPEVPSITNAQDVVDVNMDPPPTRTVTKYGYSSQWNIWEGEVNVPFDREDIITIRVSVHSYTLVWDMDESGTVAEIPQDIENQYTGDEWALEPQDSSLDTDDRDGDGRQDIMINPSAPEINNLAHQIADDKPDVYSKAKAIFDYMVKNFEYSTQEQMNYVQQTYGGLPKHALATLRDGWGDCDEQSMLYISFLRALGIPSRMVMGFLYDQETDVWGGHAWAQVYIPSLNGNGYWYTVDVVNDEFLIRDANHLTVWIEDGDGRHLNDYYHPMTYSGVADIDDSVISISYSSKGEITVNDGNSIPGFGALAVLMAIPVAITLKRMRR